MKLDRLTVTGYKSIGRLENFDLRDLNVLIGANGAGKSNFITLFRLLAAIADESLQAYVQRQGGPDSLLFGGRRQSPSIDAYFMFGFSSQNFTLETSADNRLFFSREREVSSGWGYRDVDASIGYFESRLRKTVRFNGVSPDLVAALESFRVYHFHDTSDAAPVKQRRASNDNLRLKADASNLVPYIAKLKHDEPAAYWRIVSTIQLAAPFFWRRHCQ